MANLPTMQDSNVTTKKSSLDKVLPLMAKDIGIIKNNFVKLIQQQKQTNQRSRSESFFAKALQKENMYESRSGRSSSSPSKVGSDKKGMLFDPKVGVFDFIKGFLNNVLKGMIVGGGIYGLAKVFDNPEFRKLLTDFFSKMFTVLVNGLTGAANFLSGLTKDEGFKNAIIEAFVAISKLFIDSLSMMKDVFTDDRVIKSIKDVAANLIKTIGDVLKTEVDLGKIGPVNIGKHSLGSILTTVIASMAAFRVALILATGKLLAVGAGYRGGGGSPGGRGRGGRGSRGGFGLKGLGLMAGAAGLSYLGGEATGQALDDWAQNQLSGDRGLMDDDELMSQTQGESQGSSQVSQQQSKKEISLRDAAEMALGVVGTYYGAKTLGGALMNRDARAAYKRSLRKQQAARNPKAPTPKPIAEPPKTPSRIIQQSAGSGPRDYERMRGMHNAERGPMSSRKTIPQGKGLTSSMQEKLVKFFEKIISKGKVGKLFTFISKKLSGWIFTRITALVASFLAAPFSAGISAVIGAILLYYSIEDVIELYHLIFDKGGFEETEGDGATSPTPAAATAAVAAATSPTKLSSDKFDYEKYKNFVGQFESSNNYKSDNTFGYVGRYQMGSAVLEQFGELKAGSFKKDGVKALYKPENWVKPGGLQAFLNDPTRQDSVMSKLTDYFYGGLQKSGVIKEGMTGSEIAQRLYAAHHGGLGGANALYNKGEVRYDKYLTGASTLTSAQKMAQAMGGNFGTNVPIRSSTEMASTSPRLPSNLIERNTQSLDDQKRLAVAAGGIIINDSYNTTTNADKSQTAASPPVSTPWNEEMFFRNVMNDMLS
jgi:hypothetical protein